MTTSNKTRIRIFVFACREFQLLESTLYVKWLKASLGSLYDNTEDDGISLKEASEIVSLFAGRTR